MNKKEALAYLKEQNKLTDFQKHINTMYNKLENDFCNKDEIFLMINDIYTSIEDDTLSKDEFEDMYLAMVLNIQDFDNLDIKENNLKREYFKELNIVKKYTNTIEFSLLPKPPAFHFEILIGIYGDNKAKILIDSITAFIYHTPIRINRHRNTFAKEWRNMIDQITKNTKY